MRQVMRIVLFLLLTTSYLWAAETKVSADVSTMGSRGIESSYGPKLPEGEDGQANIDAGKKIQMAFWIGGIAIGVLALISILNQLEESDKSWN